MASQDHIVVDQHQGGFFFKRCLILKEKWENYPVKNYNWIIWKWPWTGLIGLGSQCHLKSPGLLWWDSYGWRTSVLLWIKPRTWKAQFHQWGLLWSCAAKKKRTSSSKESSLRERGDISYLSYEKLIVRPPTQNANTEWLTSLNYWHVQYAVVLIT